MSLKNSDFPTLIIVDLNYYISCSMDPIEQPALKTVPTALLRKRRQLNKERVAKAIEKKIQSKVGYFDYGNRYITAAITLRYIL